MSGANLLARIAAVKAAAAAGQAGARELARLNQWSAWAKAEGHDVVGLACYALENLTDNLSQGPFRDPGWLWGLLRPPL